MCHHVTITKLLTVAHLRKGERAKKREREGGGKDGEKEIENEVKEQNEED